MWSQSFESSESKDKQEMRTKGFHQVVRAAKIFLSVDGDRSITWLQKIAEVEVGNQTSSRPGNAHLGSWCQG